MKRISSRFAAYILAPLAVLATALVRVSLAGIQSDAPLVILFVPAVVLCAWLGGLGPGLAATGAAALLLLWHFMEPPGSLLLNAPEDGVRLLLFVLQGVLVSWLFHTVRRSRRRIDKEFEARRRAEQDAARGREALDLAIGLAGMGWWDLDTATGKVAWSAGVFQMMGLEPAPGCTVPITQWLDRVHPEDRARVERALEEARARRTVYAPRHRILRADTGVVSWLDVNGRFLYDASGQAVRMIGIARDATAEVTALQSVKESEERFRILADNVPVLIWMNGLEGCEFVNQEYLRFMGVTLEDVSGMAWVDVVHPGDRDTYLRAYEQAMKERRLFEALVRLRRHDGEYRWFSSTGVPRLSAGGDLLGYVGCSMDITDLVRSQEALRQADAQKDEFLALLAHELRNPLAPLRNGVFLLQQAGDDPARRDRALAIMQRQLSHLTRLVDDLLDVSRITRGKLELRRARVEISEVLRESAESVRPLMESMGHVLQVSARDEEMVVDGDPVRLVQVVSNLLQNAAKFTPPGGHVVLTARREGAQVVVSVKDTGEGISPEMLKSIFGIFFQAPAGRLTQKGLGIGLALVRRLVELHGGTVEARSEGAGQGSEFLVYLPALREAVRTAPPETSAPRPGALPAGLRRRRVLVVDDNEDIVNSLTEVMGQMGCEVRSARDGEEALALAGLFRPEIILMDLGMPRLDGLEAARRLRRQPWARDLLLVAITGWGQEADRRRSREAGFDHHMVKPVDPAALAGMVLAMGKGGGAEAGAS